MIIWVIANISCKANSSAEVQLQFSLNDAQYHQAELSLLDNPVVFDDKLYLTLKAYSNQNIIAINANKYSARLTYLYCSFGFSLPISLAYQSKNQQ